MKHITDAIDWLSIKITAGSLLLAAMTWNQVLAGLSGIALLSTIVYNGIRIYKEVKKK